MFSVCQPLLLSLDDSIETDKQEIRRLGRLLGGATRAKEYYRTTLVNPSPKFRTVQRQSLRIPRDRGLARPNGRAFWITQPSVPGKRGRISYLTEGNWVGCLPTTTATPSAPCPAPPD